MIGVFLLGLACARPEPEVPVPLEPPPVVPAGAPGSPAPARPPDLLLITVDGLRADHLDLYGYARETAPALTRLGAAGVVFERAYAAAPWEAPALASLMSGLYPGQHGVDRGEIEGDQVSGQPGLSPEVQTLAERLSAAGYQTLAFAGTPHAGPGSGLEQGFARYLAPGLAEGGALAGLGALPEDGRPRLIWAHLREPRSPYVPRAPWAEAWSQEPAPATTLSASQDADMRARQLGQDARVGAYDSEIRATDAQIEALIARFAPDAEDVVVVLGAEGEELMDRGRLGRRASLYDEQLRVPLVVRAPGAKAGLRVAEPVSAVDLLPTLVALATGQAPEGVSGVDLGPTLRGAPAPDRLVLAELRSSDGRFLRAAIWGRWKLIRAEGADRPERALLYDLAADPAELTDRAADELAVVEALRGALDDWRAEAPTFRPEPPR